MNETEHRGWEIESSYHQHYLDDVNWDLAEDQADEYGAKFAWVVGALVVLCLALYGLNLYLTPPKVVFNPVRVIPAQYERYVVLVPAPGKDLISLTAPAGVLGREPTPLICTKRNP